jgi:hypothetical protein
MRRLYLLAFPLLLCVFIPSLLLAAQPKHGTDARWTAGMMNGLMWRQMDDIAKTYYVAGVLEVSSTLEPKAGAAIDVEKCKCNAADLIEGVDAFYKGFDDRFIRLPVVMALSMDAQRRSGIPLERLAVLYTAMLKELESMEASQRK